MPTINNIDIKIMAVLSRKKYAETLLQDIPTARIIYDDRGINGGGDAWYNAKRIWSDDIGKYSHRLVLQDDAILCDNFIKYMMKCLDFNPDVIWSFHVGWKAEKTFLPANTPYIKIKGCKTSGQAILMPTQYCFEMVSETDFFFGQEYKHDDSRIGWFCAHNGIDIFATNPQLVDHRQIKSTLPHHNSIRYSRTFKKNVDDLNWDSTSFMETPIVFPHLWTKNRRAIEYCDDAKRKVKNASNNKEIVGIDAKSQKHSQTLTKTD